MKMTGAQMNEMIRKGRGGTLITRRSSESETGQAPGTAPLLIDLFAGLELTPAQQARCFRLVEGKGRDAEGKSLPAMSAAEAIAIVHRPQATDSRQQGAMNKYIRRAAGRE